MGVELDVSMNVGPVTPVNVPLTSVDELIFQGSGILMGWSLREAGGITSTPANGSVVAPGAGAVIATTAGIAAGTYFVSWTVELAGPAAAADANNFELLNGAGVVLASVNAAAAGVYQQVTARFTIAQGDTVSVKAVGAGTAGVTYTADLEIIPDEGIGMQVELQSGDTILGEPSAPFKESATQWFGPQGILIEQAVNMHVVKGVVAGSLYIIPNY